MSVKSKVLSAGVLFFLGGQMMLAQKAKKDTLQEKKIEDVVVLGYSKTSTKPKTVSAVTTVSSDKFEGRPTTSFLNSLQGEAPGISINSSSGSPGSAKVDVIIRGVGSINAGGEPLYIIDGMISNGSQFRNLNDNDIETASVLRDAAATSVYGNRAANGVIIITTKRGRFNSPLRFSYSSLVGVNTLPTTGYDLMDAKQLLTLENRYGVGNGAKMTEDQIANYGINTNWRDVFFTKGMTQRHDLNMSVGGENVNLYTSLGYLNTNGIVPTSDFTRFNFRNNVSGRTSNRRFTYDIQSAISFSKRNQLLEETNSNIANNSVQNPLLGAVTANPYLQAGQFATGQALFEAIGQNFSGGKNIYVLEDILKEGHLPNRRTETGILLNGDFAYKLTDNLTLGNKTGVDYKAYDVNFARAPWSYLAIVVAANSAVKDVVENPYGGFETMSKSREFNFNSITRLVFDKKFGEHSLTLGAYLDYLKVHYNSSSQSQSGLNPRNWVFGAGTGYVDPVYYTNPKGGDPVRFYVPTISASKITAGTLAYFANADYDYAGKYGLQALVRRDGTYRFTKDQRWATFWSVGARWNIDKEDFMTGSAFDMLKLRASYGTQGNQNIVAAPAGSNTLLTGVNIVREVYATGTGYDNTAGALAFGGLVNPLASWEKIAQSNIGLDFSIKRRLSGSLDIYNKETSALYNDINLSAATSSYTILGNNGKLRNRGVELALKYSVINRSDAKLSVYGNVTYNRSKLLDLVRDENSGRTRNVVGGQLFEWYAAPYLGVNPGSGNLLFLDKDGNPTENIGPDDQVATGKNMYSPWIGGFGLNAEYKGFYLTSHFSFQQGGWKYDTLLSWLERPDYIGESNKVVSMLDAWTPTNNTSNVPALTAFNHEVGINYSDRYIRDASFVRLKNITFGYSIPRHLLEGTSIRGFKIFASGENLYTWTKWKGYDPEVASSLSVYPNMRTYTLGVNIDF